MNDQEWQIAIFGTFDVANYGDLLFPIIAEAELSKRLGAVKLHRFSYHARTLPEWPYEVTSLTELPSVIGKLDGVLIGGGFIIRFDKLVAPDYGPPNPTIHHPTGYWLTPALIALQHGIPLIWNAPGMHCNEVPAWAVPLVRLTLEHSPHIKVRDALSQSTLASLSDIARVEVLPDTAFGLPRLFDEQRPSAEFLALRESAGLNGPYLVVHAIAGLDSFLRLWRTHSELFPGVQVLLLPIGPVLGDHESILGDELPRAVCLPFWPQPLLLAELISHAQGVVGHSYHLAISALAFGVPVFCSADLGCGKYTALPVYERIFQITKEGEIDPLWFASKLGKQPPSSATKRALDQLVAHWDQVAQIIREGSRPTQQPLDRFWQSLPGLLEGAQEHALSRHRQIDALTQRLAAAHEQVCNLEELNQALMLSGEQMVALSDSYALKIEELNQALMRSAEQMTVLSDSHSLRIEELNRALVLSAEQMTVLSDSHSLRVEELNQALMRSGEQMSALSDSHSLRIEELNQALMVSAEQLSALSDSNSFRFTAPLRFIRRSLKPLLGK